MEEKVRKGIECHTKHDCGHCPYNKSDIMLDPRIDPDYGRNVIEAVRKCRDELIDDMGKVIEDHEERIAIMSESAEETENKLRIMFNRCICFRGSLNCDSCTMRKRCEKERTFHKGYSLVNGKRVKEEGDVDG